jgi:hypothetical protein
MPDMNIDRSPIIGLMELIDDNPVRNMTIPLNNGYKAKHEVIL